MTRLFKAEVNMVSTDSDVLVTAMLENINDLYAQVLGGCEEDAPDITDRLVYVHGAIAGMTNLLAACEVFDRSTAVEIQQFFEEYMNANRG